MPRVIDNPDEQRYELREGEELIGTLTYRARPDRVTLVHTEVRPAHEGKGMGTQLIRGAIDGLRARGLRMVPRCEFVRAYLARHPEQADLVVPR
jgi:predicted GNAT family acetyltransferase